MTHLDYWIETVQCSFDENGITGLPDDIIRQVARDMLNSAEAQGMSFSAHTGGNNDELKRKYEAKIKDLERQIEGYKDGVAKRRGIPEQNVYLGVDGVMYDLK